MTNREYINDMDNASLFEMFFYDGLKCDNCPASYNQCEQNGCYTWLNSEYEGLPV